MFWKLNFEAEEFELDMERQLPSTMISDLQKESPGGLDNALVVFDKPYYKHVIIETNASIRVLSIEGNNCQDLSAIIAPSPDDHSDYILSRTALMLAKVEDDLADKKIKLNIVIHDLEASNKTAELTQKISPTVGQVGSCGAVCLDIKGTLDDRFNLVVVLVATNGESMIESFLFVIDVKYKRVHSRGWKKWRDTGYIRTNEDTTYRLRILLFANFLKVRQGISKHAAFSELETFYSS